MHKAKVIVGITIIVIGLTFFVNEIWRGMIDEMSYQDCFKRAMESLGIIICHHFSDHILSLSYYLVAIAIGVWLLVFGLRSISLKSFGKS